MGGVSDQRHQGRSWDLEKLPSGAERGIEIEALRAEKALAEERYRTLFEQNLAGIFRASLDGRFLDVNEACARMLAFPSRDKARKCSLRSFAAGGEDYEKLMDPLLDGQSITNLEIQLRRSNGEPFWALLQASILGSGGTEEPVIEGMLIDITERKQAQEAVSQSEKRFRALVENSSDAISLVDSSGSVLSSSHAISPIFGYALDERVGRNIFELVHPDDRQPVLQVFGQLVRDPGGSVTCQMRYRHKNGSWRWIEALGTNMLEDPSVRAVVVNYRDITERRLLLQQLFQAQKMEAVGQLAGGVAHDFNNLLTAILGYGDLVLEKLPRNSAARRYTTEIKKAGERAASLTRQLLAFSRLQVLAPQVIDLNALIADLSKMLRRLIGDEITLTTIPGAVLGRIKADPTQIEQVIMNLAVNARDAMPDGGELTTRTSNAVLEETITAEGLQVRGGSYVLIEVSDNGCGMDSQTRARIFEPFFTTKEKGKGTGLGLSTVYGIVKQSEGYIWASSEPGQGATFRIYFPAVDEDLSTARPQPSQERKHSGSETILLVEDENVVRTLLVKVLRNLGYHVIEASHGAHALETARHYAEEIHLMLTDVAMPRMNGQELARQMKEIHPEAKVLFMTGYGGQKVGSTAILERGVPFINKPFMPDLLSLKVRETLDAPA